MRGGVGAAHPGDDVGVPLRCGRLPVAELVADVIDAGAWRTHETPYGDYSL